MLILIKLDSSMASRMVLIITVSVQLFLLYVSQLLIAMRTLCIRLIKWMLVANLALEQDQLQVRS